MKSRRRLYHSKVMAHKVTIYYRCSWTDVHRIQERFGIQAPTTVNGETACPVEISDEDWPLLQETERRGFIQIRNKSV